MAKTFPAPWWAREEVPEYLRDGIAGHDLTSLTVMRKPVRVRITEDDLRILAGEIALLTGLESVVFAVNTSVGDLAWGFDIAIPEKPQAAVPGSGVAGERARAWRDVWLGALRGARVRDPIMVPELAEGENRLWLDNLTVGRRILLRCGVVTMGHTEIAPPALDRAARMCSRRLMSLVWERVGDAWERHLNEQLESLEAPKGEEEEFFQLRLDLLARETARVLGCDGAGVYTWREAWGGYLLDGYFGPSMEGRPDLHGPEQPEVSGWWFHAAGDPSLVRSVGGVENGAACSSPILVWSSAGRGTPEANPAALKVFRDKYKEVPLRAAVAAQLRIHEDPLRPVLVAFGTSGSAWHTWVSRIHDAWHDVLGSTSGYENPMSRLYGRVLHTLERSVARVLQERRQHQGWLVAQAGSSLPVEETSSREEGRTILEGIRDLAGAWSGTLWAFYRDRRKALALLHPLKGDEDSVYEWHQFPTGSGLQSILERLHESKRRLGLTYFEKRRGSWKKRFEDDLEWTDAAENTARWLELHAREGHRLTVGSARLERAGELVGALTLSWRHPPLGRARLEELLVPVLDGVGSSLALLVVLEEERTRTERERQLDEGINTVFQRWLAGVRTEALEGRLADAPAGYVADVVKEAAKTMGRRVEFFRYERWNHDNVARGGFEEPVVRKWAPVFEHEPYMLDQDLVTELVKQAKEATEGQLPRPSEVARQGEISDMDGEDGAEDSARPARSTAFPAVVGTRISGLLVVEGSEEELTQELATWQGVALTIGYTADLIRRSVYRTLDRGVAPAIFKAVRRAGKVRRSADVVARAIVDQTRRISGARWAAVLERGHDRTVRVTATAGAADRSSLVISDRWKSLRKTIDDKIGSCFAFDPADSGEGGPQLPDDPHDATAGLVVPLRSPGGLHGWLVAVADRSWSLDAARILEALALRAAPFLAHALETDRIFLGLASTQHAARSAWQQAYGALDLLELRLEQLLAVDEDTKLYLETLDEGLERAGARMASTLYLATGGEVEASAGRSDAASFNELIRGVNQMYRIMMADKGLNVEVHVPESHVPIPGDPLLVRLIVENLVENAVKYARRGRTLGIRLIHRVGSVTLEVEDEGLPFSRETWERYLEPFTRLDAGEPGFGVGLWVVADCCRRLRATLEPPASRQIQEGLHQVMMRVRFIPGR